MLPIRHSTIFKSRWWALAWAAGILWTAVDFASGASAGDGAGNAGDNAAASADGAAGGDPTASQIAGLLNAVS